MCIICVRVLQLLILNNHLIILKNRWNCIHIPISQKTCPPLPKSMALKSSVSAQTSWAPEATFCFTCLVGVLNLSNWSRKAHSAFAGAYRGHDWRIEAVHLSVSLWATAFWEQNDTQPLKDRPEKTKRPQLTVTNGTSL